MKSLRHPVIRSWICVSSFQMDCTAAGLYHILICSPLNLITLGWGLETSHTHSSNNSNLKKKKKTNLEVNQEKAYFFVWNKRDLVPEGAYTFRYSLTENLKNNPPGRSLGSFEISPACKWLLEMFYVSQRKEKSCPKWGLLPSVSWNSFTLWCIKIFNQNQMLLPLFIQVLYYPVHYTTTCLVLNVT